MSWERMRSLFEQMPLEVIREFEGQIRRFVNDRLRDRSWYESGWLPALDLSETAAAYLLEADLPGVAKDSVAIEVVGNVVTIRGERVCPQAGNETPYKYRERRFGRFERSFPLPEKLQEDAATAVMENGVLTVTLPKSEPAQAHPIHVDVR